MGRRCVDTPILGTLRHSRIPSNHQPTNTHQRSSGGAVHELTFKGQQLRGGEPGHAQAPIMGDPDRPLRKELLGRLLGLRERLLSARGDRQALGERVHHIRAGERRRLGREPLPAGQLVQDLADLLSSGRPAALTAADLGELPLTHPLLRKLGRPPRVHALLAL
jgi:hypothetical protein